MRFNTTIFSTLLLTVCILLSGCSRIRKAARTADVQPEIFPDYIGVTVPVNIAPLNFMMEGVEEIQATFSVGGEEMATVCGSDGVVDIAHYNSIYKSIRRGFTINGFKLRYITKGQYDRTLL